MKAIRCILVLLVPAVVHSFHPIPIAVRKHFAGVASNSNGDLTYSTRYVVPRTNAALVLSMSSSSAEKSEELPRLPPIDYNKKSMEGVESTTGESTAVIGHVMPNLKFTLSFTCNVCDGHNMRKINRVSFMHGIVLVWCQSCNQKHLIADNLGKLDFPEFGRNLEEFMAKKGTPVKRLVMSKDGMSHIEVQVPGPDYPERKKMDFNPKEFDGKSLLPGMHTGGSSLFPGISPTRSAGVGEESGVVGTADEELDSAGSDA